MGGGRRANIPADECVFGLLFLCCVSVALEYSEYSHFLCLFHADKLVFEIRGLRVGSLFECALFPEALHSHDDTSGFFHPT